MARDNAGEHGAARWKSIAYVVALAAVTALTRPASSAAQTPPLPKFDPDTLASGAPNPLRESDGALILSAPPNGPATVEFNPLHMQVGTNGNVELCTQVCAHPIDPDHDNVFHFSTITIPSGVTVRLLSKWTPGPVYWLATGAVNIAGVVNLSGEDGQDRTMSTADRRPAYGGPGGFLGGVGGNRRTDSTTPAGTGLGPAGGGGASTPAWPGEHRGHGAGPLPGGAMLVPLVGGSGGGGGADDNLGFSAGGGGGGGGAILIASAVSITMSAGQIIAAGGYGGRGTCNGCCSYYGGGGTAGEIRLAAPILQGTGFLYTYPGAASKQLCGVPFDGQPGRVRLEAFQHLWSWQIQYGTYTTGSPLNSFVPTAPQPSIRVVTIAGAPVATDLNGGFTPPDVTINNKAEVPVVIEAKNIPPGTKPTLSLFSLDGADQLITAPALQGTQQLSTTTAPVTFPSGFTRGYVHATW